MMIGLPLPEVYCDATSRHYGRCYKAAGHAGPHGNAMDAWDSTRTDDYPYRPVPLAAEVSGLTQQALEKYHELVTYHLSSACVMRHKDSLDKVRELLVAARNQMASVTLALGKELP